jgi:hypothetical protein
VWCGPNAAAPGQDTRFAGLHVTTGRVSCPGAALFVSHQHLVLLGAAIFVCVSGWGAKTGCVCRMSASQQKGAANPPACTPVTATTVVAAAAAAVPATAVFGRLDTRPNNPHQAASF